MHSKIGVKWILLSVPSEQWFLSKPMLVYIIKILWVDILYEFSKKKSNFFIKKYS